MEAGVCREEGRIIHISDEYVGRSRQAISTFFYFFILSFFGDGDNSHLATHRRFKDEYRIFFSPLSLYLQTIRVGVLDGLFLLYLFFMFIS